LIDEFINSTPIICKYCSMKTTIDFSDELLHMTLVTGISMRVNERSGGEEGKNETSGFEAAQVGIECGEGKICPNGEGGKVGIHPDLG